MISNEKKTELEKLFVSGFYTDKKIIEEKIIELAKENHFYLKKSIYAKFPAHYHIIPVSIRNFFMKKITNINSPKFAEFLKENRCFNIFDKYMSPNEKKYIYFTFDIDSSAGYKKIDAFIYFLLKKKLSDSFKIIVFLPAAAFEYSDMHLSDLIKENIQIGCHGYDHSGKLQFDNENNMNRKFAVIKEFCARYNIKKFRAPAFVLTSFLYGKLKNVFDEDWSFRDFFVKDNCASGCFYSGVLNDSGLLIIPLNTIPDCDYLQTNWQYREIIELFSDKISYLLKNNFSPVLLFHPEPHFSGSANSFALYKDIVEKTIELFENIK